MRKLKENNHLIIFLFLPIISLIMHFHIFKLDLVGYHVWRQTQTQTVINNFYNEDFNILNSKFNDNANTDRIVRMEFPIMQWIIAQSYRLFGSDVMVSRIFTFIIGLISVFGMYFFLLIIFNNRLISIFGAWCFNFSPVFYYYTVNPLPDNFALCCAIWSIVCFLKWLSNNRLIYIVFSAIFICLAALSKLPFILYVSIFGTYIFLKLRENNKTNLKSTVLVLFIYIIILLPAIIWYFWVIPTWNGNGILFGILELKNSPSEIIDILQHNLISTLPELLINYAALPFFFVGFYFIFKYKIFKSQLFPIFFIWSISILLYFVFELNMIAKVHDYYLFPFLPILFIIVAYGAYNLFMLKNQIFKFLTVTFLVILPLTAYLRSNSRWNTESPGFNVDFYNNKTELRNLVRNEDKIIIGADNSHFILLYYVNKKGWTFDDFHYVKNFQNWINYGAKYLYTDNRIDTISEIKKYLGQKIYDKGSIRVYKLSIEFIK
jgi:hypothetical protein